MLSRTTRVQLIAFVVIALLGITYVGVRYIDVARWVGASGYTVRVDLADSGGIFTDAEVDYRGVPVGRVGDMRLAASGIQIDLRIDSDDKIPRDVRAVVANRSVIGEQYVNLEPRSDAGPYLAEGSLIQRSATELPPPVQDLLTSGDTFFRSVPLNSLRTVVGELYTATQGLGGNLSQLLKSGNSLFRAADDRLPQTVDLIQAASSVLATQNAQSTQITTFARNLALIGAQLKKSDGDVSKVLARAGGAADQFGGFIDDVRGTLHDLLANLLPVSVAFYQSQDGVRDVLVNLPLAVTIGGQTITPEGINVGLVPTFFDPLPCIDGYEATHERTGLNTDGQRPLATDTGCTIAPAQGNVRGAQNAPGPGAAPTYPSQATPTATPTSAPTGAPGTAPTATPANPATGPTP